MHNRLQKQRSLRLETIRSLETLVLSVYVLYCILSHQFGLPLSATLMLVVPATTVILTSLIVTYWQKHKALRIGNRASDIPSELQFEIRMKLFFKFAGYGGISVGAQEYSLVYIMARHDYLIGAGLAIVSVAALVAMTRPLAMFTVMTPSYRNWVAEGDFLDVR
jgi:hypothetical protein